jgi:hypothetical protein
MPFRPFHSFRSSVMVAPCDENYLVTTDRQKLHGLCQTDGTTAQHSNSYKQYLSRLGSLVSVCLQFHHKGVRCSETETLFGVSVVTNQLVKEMSLAQPVL